MRGSGPLQERLRAFVREYVHKDGAHYRRGAQTELARVLGLSQSWVSEYVDDEPAVNASLDQAAAMCAFFGVKLDAFTVGPSLTLRPTKVAASQGGADDGGAVSEVSRLRVRIARLEHALQRIAAHTSSGAELAARALEDRPSGTPEPRRRAAPRSTPR